MKSLFSMKPSLLLIFFVIMNILQSSNGLTYRAKLTLNGFEKGEDGGGPSECDGKYHSNDMPVVALSTQWYKGRCFKSIVINAGNGRSAVAKVVDECDTSGGCARNIVDASRAVWRALGVPRSKWGDPLSITWREA